MKLERKMMYIQVGFKMVIRSLTEQEWEEAVKLQRASP